MLEYRLWRRPIDGERLGIKNMRIAIISCSKLKGSASCPARDLYRGVLFKAAVRYAEQRCDEIYIISALHGLIHGDKVIEPYQAFQGNWRHYSRMLESPDRDEFNHRLKNDLLKLSRAATLIYLCNQFYSDLGPPGEYPLKGMDFYKRRKFLMENRRTIK